MILGATGSIGRQACDVIARYPDHFELVGAVAGRDAAALRAVVQRFGVRNCALVNPANGNTVDDGWGAGMEAACEVASVDCDVVLVAITGAAALQPALAALEQRGRLVAVATKEVLVMAGEVMRKAAARSGARIVPVDSEHSALWQCLRGERADSVARLVLTASGGPFLQRGAGSLASITPAEALAHPTWRMGPKVTIDSATMMNKGLEIIEAHFLFDMDYARIDVSIHPDSIVHSYVEFVDGAILAQLGVPDMRVPIAIALSDGERLPGVGPRLELREGPPLRMLPVDPEQFPAVDLARSAGLRGGTSPCVLNAANEVAVQAFLEGRCRFDEIVPLVAETVGTAPPLEEETLDALIGADAWARSYTSERIPGMVSAR